MSFFHRLPAVAPNTNSPVAHRRRCQSVFRRAIAFRSMAMACIAVAVSSHAFAQAQSGAASAGKRISLTRSVEPSFRVEPVVHRFRARRGEVIPFSFEIASTGKIMNVDISAVNLRQEETGIILHDENSKPMGGVRFTSPKQFQLRPGEKFQIEGEVTVPLNKTNYVSFGILVRDGGQISDNPNEPLETGKTRAAIRFVTQYVLRVDIETGAQDVGDMNRLHFDRGELIAKDGLPYINAYLTNPTDDALECDVRAQLNANDSATTAPIRLNMPSRSELKDDSRYLVRIMPHSRLRLEGPVKGVIPEGDYDLNVRLSNGRRSMVQADFPTRVDSNSFRGLSALVATLGDGLSIEPAQVELGRVSDANRMTTLQFLNRGNEPKSVRLIAKDHAGVALDGIMLTSKSFVLKPGRSKTVRAMLRGQNDANHQWGTLEVVCDEENASKQLPLALIHAQRPEIQLFTEEMQWAQLPTGNAFTMKVQNRGDGYAPLFADLKLAATKGHPVKLSDGFGAWLAPGQTRELQFVVPETTQPGPYQITLDVRSANDLIVAERTLMLELTPEMLGQASEQVAARP
ncbi:hypothetical protein [Rhodopirellula sp. SWK7]|uniref:COG1470 family protein n=1 Tax=Rhodopirellula sp. SWK7 TaxID=595460 RepID=UPI00034AF085|nr:hypothetical protein [Rhodopirellula sp. SWK7]